MSEFYGDEPSDDEMYSTSDLELIKNNISEVENEILSLSHKINNINLKKVKNSNERKFLESSESDLNSKLNVLIRKNVLLNNSLNK